MHIEMNLRVMGKLEENFDILHKYSEMNDCTLSFNEEFPEKDNP